MDGRGPYGNGANCLEPTRTGPHTRLAGIDSIGAANHFLQTHFLPEWEQRFTVTPRNPRNAHRRLGREHRLEEILSVRGAAGGRGSYGQLGPKSLAGTGGGSLCGASGSCGRDRTAVGWKPLVALPRALSEPAPLPRTPAAVRKSFRPTASRTCGTNTETSKQNKTQMPCASRSPLEKAMEADISMWRETGHFYFALTRNFEFVFSLDR